jgi:hypothetical protein
MIKDKGDFFELDIVVEKFSRKVRNLKVNGKFILDEEGNKMKEEKEIYMGYVLNPTSFLKEGITLYGKTLNHRYQLYKKRSTIYDKFSQKFYVVNHMPQEIEKALLRRSYIGFKTK